MSRRHFKIGLLCLGLASWVAVQAAGPSGEGILRQTANASQRVSYRGTRLTMLWLERRTEALECLESADGHGRFRVEYLAPRTAKGRIVIDDGRNRWQIEPGVRQVWRTPTSPLEKEDHWNVALLIQNYQVTVDPRLHSIAHRSAYKLTLIPRHPGKPRKILWIDTQTSLVLKREARQADGSPVRSTSFSEITFNPPTSRAQFTYQPSPDVKVVSLAPPSRRQNPRTAHQLIGAPAPFPQRFPALGFACYGALSHEENGQPTVHLLYEDGLLTLSLFVDRQARQAALRNAQSVRLNGQVAWLRTDPHFTVLRWAKGGLRYTLVGDLTAKAMLKVGHDLLAAR